MLVSRDYMTRLDERVFRTQPQPDVIAPPSRFYDIRPAVITSDWIQNASGIWYAEGRFITQDGIVDDSFVFPIWAPTANDEPETTTNETRVFVVWRGRWEMIGGVGGGDVNLTAGVGIRINGSAPNYTIVNAGVTNFIAGGNTYSGTLQFSNSDFTIDRTLQLVGIANRKTRVNVEVTMVDSNTVEITFTLA